MSKKFNSFIKWAKGAFEESPGTASSMRIIAILVTLNVMVIWGYTCIKNQTYQDIGLNTVLLIATVWGCKAIQHFSEK